MKGNMDGTTTVLQSTNLTITFAVMRTPYTSSSVWDAVANLHNFVRLV